MRRYFHLHFTAMNWLVAIRKKIPLSRSVCHPFSSMMVLTLLPWFCLRIVEPRWTSFHVSMTVMSRLQVVHVPFSFEHCSRWSSYPFFNMHCSTCWRVGGGVGRGRKRVVTNVEKMLVFKDWEIIAISAFLCSFVGPLWIDIHLEKVDLGHFLRILVFGHFLVQSVGLQTVRFGEWVDGRFPVFDLVGEGLWERLLCCKPRHFYLWLAN